MSTEPSLTTCECGETWWESRRQIQIPTRDDHPTAKGYEPRSFAHRNVLVCTACGKQAP